MPAVNDLILAFLRLRDAYVHFHASDTSSPRRATYKQIMDFAVSKKNHLQEAIQFLKLVFENEGDLWRFSDTTIFKTLLSSEHYKQCYRITKAVDVVDDEDDHRVRTFFKHAVEHNRKCISRSSLLTKFFRAAAVLSSKSKSPSETQDLFATKMPSRFEMLLYLMSLVNIYNTQKHSINSTKRQKLQDGSTSRRGRKTLASFRSSSVEDCQRLAFAVQQVVRAWNVFAKSLGFRGTEHMLLPYIMYNRKLLRFVPISNRAQGFSSPSLRKRLSSGDTPVLIQPQNTRSPPKTKHLQYSTTSSSGVARESPLPCSAPQSQLQTRTMLHGSATDSTNPEFTRSDTADAAFRQLAQQFLRDLTDAVLNDFLYSMDETKVKGVISTNPLAQFFRRAPRQVPPRFERIPQHISEAVKTTPGCTLWEQPPSPGDNIQLTPKRMSHAAHTTNGATTQFPADVIDLTSCNDDEVGGITPSTPNRNRGTVFKSNTEPSPSLPHRAQKMEPILEALETPDTEMDLAPQTFPPHTVPDVNRVPYSVEATGILPPHNADDPQVLQALKNVQTYMEEYFRFYCCEATDFIATDEALRSNGGSALGKVQLVLTDPPYNIRKQAEKHNSSYDSLTPDEMHDVAALICRLLRPGGHFIVFCSAQQFRIWHSIFGKLHTRSLADASCTSAPAFRVDSTPFVFLRAPSNYTRHPGRRSSSLLAVTEFAVHGVKNGKEHTEQDNRQDYHNFNHVPTTFAAHKNVIDNIPHLQPGEALRWRRRTSIRSSNLVCPTSEKPLPLPQRTKSSPSAPNSTIRTEMVRPEQKSMALLKELICRFSNTNDLVVDLFAGTFSTALACIELPQPRRFLGCENDIPCFLHARHNAILHYVRIQGERIASEMPRRRGAIELVQQTFPGKILNASKAWKAPKGCPQYQTVPQHIISWLLSKSQTPSQLQSCTNKPVHEWPLHLRGLLNVQPPLSLLHLDAAAYGLYLTRSTIKHTDAGLGVFSSRSFMPGEVVTFFYGTLVYHNLYNRKHRHTTYGKGILGATPDRFRRYSIEVRVCGTDFQRHPMYGKKETALSVWIVPAPFSTGGHINDASYIEGDEERDKAITGKLQKRRPNVVLRTRKTMLTSRAALRDYRALPVVASKNILPGDELFLNYGSSYDWKSLPSAHITSGTTFSIPVSPTSANMAQ